MLIIIIIYYYPFNIIVVLYSIFFPSFHLKYYCSADKQKEKEKLFEGAPKTRTIDEIKAKYRKPEVNSHRKLVNFI